MLKQVQHDSFWLLVALVCLVIPNLIRDLIRTVLHPLQFRMSRKMKKAQSDAEVNSVWQVWDAETSSAWRFLIASCSCLSCYPELDSGSKKNRFTFHVIRQKRKIKSTVHLDAETSSAWQFLIASCSCLSCYPGLVPGSKRNGFTHFVIPAKAESQPLQSGPSFLPQISMVLGG